MHGAKYLSRGEVMPPLPPLGATLRIVPLPRTLVFLHLQDMVVTPDVFDALPWDLPELRMVRLFHCGCEASGAIGSLRTYAPKLELANCILVEGPERVSHHKDAPSRTHAKHGRFPSCDLAGLSAEGIIDALVTQGYGESRQLVAS